ncbi:MAG: CheY-P phosphatase CheC [Candidatus Aerophobetes bacterium ADurb.Bin490]|mgnify:CR=1 FL=1|nr:MAG: CheY-P phosphatase CheC [Candidatus Aerophobetes bacterium ADurb.Bin490]HNZ29826.1 chemotaxis protein CheC [Candidatus Goldiibacteriota bacterium]HPI03082.1 chemotaxis protein CheC [Candidatus Goldiibacteriota bacterium]HPN63802.1 chemotaxis protein CheC [Candidatus Goldiibacteriota bacterium]HRQ42843.1 chemotaxis protein CheC [Candidatus Goldiibacteriota bacterium]
MPDDSLLTLTEIQVDALKEVGNVGAGHAATALSQLLKKKIMISVPQVKILKLQEVENLLGDSNTLVAGIIMNVLGDVTAKILLLLTRESALSLADMLLQNPVGTTKVLSEVGNSAIKETGNILAGAYMNALNEFLGLLLLPSVPSLVFDISGAILNSLSEGFEGMSTHILSIETQFSEANDKVIKGYLLLVPDIPSVKVLLSAIRVE